MEITKVKQKKTGLVVSYTTTKMLKNNEVSYINRTDVDDAEPHDDFKTALKALTPHLISLADQKNDKSVEATGVSFKGEGDDLKIIITGVKETESGIIAINTGLYSVYGSDYVGEDKLKKAIEALKEETELYLGGKAGESNQLSLFAVEADEEEEDETF